MTLDQWTAVDQYFDALFVPSDPALEAALHASTEAGLPPANVSASQGKLLMLLAQLQGARSILELGTLGGYSTIWLARALPAGGHLISLELNPDYAAVARQNITHAGLSAVVDIRVGPALDSLQRLVAEQHPPFDMVFIDADKRSNADYVTWALKLTRLGSLIIVDNVVRDGKVIDGDSTDPSVVGTRLGNDLIAAEPRLSSVAVQTVGSKGYDGFVMAIVTGE